MPTRAVIHRSTLIGHPMAGDPRFDDGGADGLMVRRACQYAAAMFWRDGALAAVFRIPDRVMDFRVVCEEER